MSAAHLESPLSSLADTPIDRLHHVAEELETHIKLSDKPEVTIYTTLEPVEAVWRSIERHNLNSPHQAFDWCKSWAQTQGNPLLIVLVTISGKTVLILPLEIVKQRGGKIARFIGSPYSNINTGLMTPSFAHDATADVMQAIRDELRTTLRDKADLLQLGKMPQYWQGQENPLCSHWPQVKNQNSAFQLPLKPTFEETLEQLNAKRRRKKFRTSVKRLNELGGFEHVTAQTTEEKRELLETFFSQKAIRFKKLGLPDVFKEKSVRDFFHNAANSSTDGENYALALHAIRMKDTSQTIIAVAGLSRKGNHIICQFGSIDEDKSVNTSPGELLFHLMIEEANASKAEIFDFGIGDQRYKQSWCSQETPHFDVLLALTTKGKVLVAIEKLTTKIKTRIKNNKTLYNLIQKQRAS